MNATSARSVGSESANIVHRGEGGAGPFMLTLCRLVEPVSIRPPQSPHLKPFTFFTSRTRLPDGSEPLCLHMGFFDTPAHADRWARAVRGRHPDAIVAAAPRALWPGSDFAGPEGAADRRHFAPVDNVSLTDTQVLDMLEMRHPAAALGEPDAEGSGQIELLRPDDTVTRLALKDAVVKGMPVSFAVQLEWSARPLDTTHLPALAIFKSGTLYALESRSASRSCFFLRFGFFADPISAKQVASHVRTSFASAAVVPVLDEEVMLAREACLDTSLIPCLLRQRADQAPESGGGSGWSSVSKPARRGGAASEGTETLEQILSQLAEREMLNDPDM